MAASISIDTRGPIQPPASCIGRVAGVVEAIRGRDAAVTLTDIADRTGLPRSTVHRMLEQMVTVGWVRRRGLRYVIGPALQ
ncbi:helix-turn-helix domain-containing protein [Nocardia donostiensis]|uniref:HTH iclR-type domain-containing protein n=1 Tax=Nocardia donostiensis TaxID=1538463 RepID=A0A1W0B5N5_9NOCA|nr:helix-turn-helix domain-containing protein [Nocardia donostiensis]ONM46033.1 hypothetical protein B0T46_25175 [Nocardia donostiensis]OQS17741.1 hypothetical protein B0T44_23235 [Nocardia donostiensis]